MDGHATNFRPNTPTTGVWMARPALKSCNGVFAAVGLASQAGDDRPGLSQPFHSLGVRSAGQRKTFTLARAMQLPVLGCGAVAVPRRSIKADLVPPCAMAAAFPVFA